MSYWSALKKVLDGSTPEGQKFWNSSNVGNKLVKAQQFIQKIGLEEPSVRFVKPFVKFADQTRLANQTLNSSLFGTQIDNNLINKVQDNGMLSEEGKMGGRELWNTLRNTANVGLKSAGLMNPGLAGQSMLTGATISPLIQAGINAYNKRPITEGLGQSAVSGSVNALGNAGTTRLTRGLVESLSKVVPILRPLTTEALHNGLPTVKDALGEGIRKWAGTLGKRLIKGAVIETLVETPIWASINQGDREKFVDVLQREAVQNLIYNVGFAGLDSLKDTKTLLPIVRTSIDSAIQNYKDLPIAEKMGGFVQIPGRSRLQRIENEKFIKDYDSKSQHTADEIKRYREISTASQEKIKAEKTPLKLTAPSDLLVSHEGAPDKERVKYYEDLIDKGGEIEPIKVIREGEKYGIEDGKHRYQAYVNKGVKDIPIELVETKGKGNFGHVGVPGQKGGSAQTKITPEDIYKYDGSHYRVYNTPNGQIETYETNLSMKDIPTFFNIARYVDSKLEQTRARQYDVLDAGIKSNDPNYQKEYSALEKSYTELAHVQNALSNVRMGNDPKEVFEDAIRYIENPSKEYLDFMNQIKDFKISENRNSFDITGGKLKGEFDKFKEIGKKTLTYKDVDKIEPKQNDEVVGELISSGWKGQLVNPEARAFKTMLAKLYDVDVPIEEDKNSFGGKAFSDSMYNDQVDIATNKDNISALKWAIKSEQEALKQKYPSGKITLYRGVQSKDIHEDSLFSSWSDDPNVGNRFAGKKGSVIEKEFPIENVVLSHNTQKALGRMGENMPDPIKALFGPGDQESEYLIINKPVKAEVKADLKPEVKLTDDLVPSQSGSGELLVDKNSLIQPKVDSKPVNDIEKRVVDTYGFTSDKKNVGFLTADGKNINSSNNDTGSHLEVAMVGLNKEFDDKTLDNESRIIADYLSKTGQIRVLPDPISGQTNFQLVKQPTQDQWSRMKAIAGNKELIVDLTYKNGDTAYGKLFDNFNEFKSWYDRNVNYDSPPDNIKKWLSENGEVKPIKTGGVTNTPIKDIKYDFKRGQVEVQYDLSKGIKSNSSNSPIIVDENNTILDGAHRLEEARLRGDTYIKTIKINNEKFNKMSKEELGKLGVNLEKSSVRSGTEFDKYMDEHYYGIKPIKTGTPEQAKTEFLNTMETQLRRSGMENEISTYKDGKFSYKTISSDKLEGERLPDNETVKEYEAKIKAGEKPKVLVRKQAGDLWISDGNHKLKAYKNLGIKDIPVIEVDMDKPEQVNTELLSEAKNYKSASEFVKAQTELRQYKGGLDSISKKVSIDSIKPSQSGEDLYNDTSRSYSKGGPAENIFTGESIKLKPVTSPEVLPPIVVDNNGKIIDGNHRWASAKISGLKEIRVVTKSQLEAVWKQAQPRVKTKSSFIRYANDVNANTDTYRGGTWFTNDEGSRTIKEAMNPKNVSEVGIGGDKTFNLVSEPKNPLVIKNANLADGSFAVISHGYENFIKPKYAKIAYDLWTKVDDDDVRIDGKIDSDRVDMIILDSLYDADIPEKDALNALNILGKNKFDVAMDLIITKGLKEEGYDGLLLKEDGGKGQHLMVFKTKLTPTKK